MSAITNLGVEPKSGGLKIVKFYVFDGEDEDKWNEYSIKMLAFAETKGWMEGLTDENTSDEKKKKAKSYPTMSLAGKAFKFLIRSKNPKDIWEALVEEFAPTEEDDRYELEEKFKRCTMVDDYSNPTDWFDRIDEIKLQIRMNLPEEVYSEVITLFKDYANISLKEMKQKIKQFHRRLKGSDKIKESKEDSVMQLNNHENKNQSSNRNKQFKGKCHNWGELGIRPSECPYQICHLYDKIPQLDVFIPYLVVYQHNLQRQSIYC